MKCSRFLSVVLALCASLAMGQGSGHKIDVYTFAQYQDKSTTDTQKLINLDAQANPPNELESWSEILKSGPVLGGSRVVAWDDAEGYARSTMPGTVGVHAHAGGWSPTPGAASNVVRAGATARQFTKWIATSDPSVTTASLDLTAALDGFLYLGWNYASSSELLGSFVSYQVLLDTGSGFNQQPLLLYGSIERTGLSTNVITANGAGSANWTSSFIDNTASGTYAAQTENLLFDVDFQETFGGLITVPTNTPFTIQVNLSVQANNFIGPFEHFATSHFSKTGSLSLGTSTPGVVLQTVPEPSSLAALGLLFLGARRRRQI